MCVQDADRLDALGAAVARTAPLPSGGSHIGIRTDEPPTSNMAARRPTHIIAQSLLARETLLLTDMMNTRRAKSQEKFSRAMREYVDQFLRQAERESYMGFSYMN